MYVVIVINEDKNRDDKGGCCGLSKDGDNAHDHQGDRQRGNSINASGGAGGGAAGCASFFELIRADGERCCQPGATQPPNASVTSLALAAIGPLSSKV